ncbi:MAG: hypothetical protein GWN93_06060 [Deltaproteobacteria bacterium]|nr:hypothetical protein [Deltaproteobacteria bacterium]
MIPKGSIVTVKASVLGARGSTLVPEFPAHNELCKHVRGAADTKNVRMYHTSRYSSSPGSPQRNLWKYDYPQPWRGIVVGWSTRQTGKVYPAGGDMYDYEPGYLQVDMTFTVIMVQPLDTNRWVRPIACLEEDLDVSGDSDS